MSTSHPARQPSFGDRFAVQWHLSDRCSRRCAHCYREGETRADLGPDERREILEEILRFLEQLGTPGRIHFAGGEPLECDDLLPLMRVAGQRGIPSRVLTNGLGVSPTLARELQRAGCVGVQVSVEGSEAVHDALRGHGTFRGALAGADTLREAGVPVTLSMTLHRMNLEEIEALARVAQGRAVRLYYSRLVPLGRGAGLCGSLLRRSEWLLAMRRVLAVWRSGRFAVAMRDPTFRPLFLEEELARRARAVAGCAAGYNTLTIESDGTVMPCRRLGVSLGRLGVDRLADIWQESPLLAALRDRDRLGGRCGGCPYRWVCGGCRAVAAALGGDPLAEDPQCPWRGASLEALRRRAGRAVRRVRTALRGAAILGG